MEPAAAKAVGVGQHATCWSVQMTAQVTVSAGMEPVSAREAGLVQIVLEKVSRNMSLVPQSALTSAMTLALASSKHTVKTRELSAI